MEFSAAQLDKHRQAVGEEEVFHSYLMLEAGSCGVPKRLITKSGSLVCFGPRGTLEAFKNLVIENRPGDSQKTGL